MNFDNLQPEADVVIWLYNPGNSFILDFSRPIDQELMSEIKALEVQPFCSWLNDFSDQSFHIGVYQGWSHLQVAEVLASELVQKHHLKVKRRVYYLGSGHYTDYESFQEVMLKKKSKIS